MLGGIIERYLFLSLDLFGWGWALRPVPLAFLALSAYVVLAPLRDRWLGQSKPQARPESKSPQFVALGSVAFCAVTIGVLVLALVEASGWSAEAGTVPLVVGSAAILLFSIVLVVSALTLINSARSERTGRGILRSLGEGLRLEGGTPKGVILLGLMFLYVIASHVIGMLPAVLLFVPAAHMLLGGRQYGVMAVFTLLLFGAVYALFDELLAVPWAHPVVPWFQDLIARAF